MTGYWETLGLRLAGLPRPGDRALRLPNGGLVEVVDVQEGRVVVREWGAALVVPLAIWQRMVGDGQ